MASESIVTCLACGSRMSVPEETITQPSGGAIIEVYLCGSETCGRRAALVFEPQGGLSEDQQTWVEREIGRRGAFFPSDYGRSGPGRLRSE